jgi:hypothetical protein
MHPTTHTSPPGADTATLAAVLGPEFWTFGHPTLAAAQAHAARRMAAGRPAVVFTAPDGVHVCAYGVRP